MTTLINLTGAGIVIIVDTAELLLFILKIIVNMIVVLIAVTVIVNVVYVIVLMNKKYRVVKYRR